MSEADVPELPMSWFERHRQLATYGGLIVGLLLVGIIATVVTPPATWGAPDRQLGHPVALIIDPTDGQTVYVGTEAGKILSSDDNGQTWNDHSGGLPPKIAVSALLRSSDGSHFLAGTSAGIFTQSGDKWTAISAGLPNGDGVDALAFAGTDNATWLAGTELHGVYRSTDAGKTWTPASGLPDNADVYGLTTLPDKQTVYAALIGAGIYRSNDGGQTWAATNGQLPAKTDAFAIAALLDAKNNVTALLAATSAGVWRSTDGGTTWTAANAGLPKTRVISLALNASSSQQIVAGTDVGVYYSSSGGTAWGMLAKGLPTNQHIGAVAFSNKSGSYAYAAADVLYRFPGSTNSAATLIGRVAFLGALVTAFVWISTRQRRILRDVVPKLPPELERPGAAGRLASTNRPKPGFTPGATSHIRGGPPPKVPDEVDETADATDG